MKTGLENRQFSSEVRRQGPGLRGEHSAVGTVVCVCLVGGRTHRWRDRVEQWREAGKVGRRWGSKPGKTGALSALRFHSHTHISRISMGGGINMTVPWSEGWILACRRAPFVCLLDLNVPRGVTAGPAPSPNRAVSSRAARLSSISDAAFKRGSFGPRNLNLNQDL